MAGSRGWEFFGVSVLLDLLARHGGSGDEVDKAVAVGFGWDGRYLGLWIGHAFPEVLDAFDEAVLVGMAFISLTAE